jgi:hypothetical protein
MFSPSRSGGSSCESFVTCALLDWTFWPSASTLADSSRTSCSSSA